LFVSREFEVEIKDYTGDDPLANWLEYCKWIDNHYPSDTRKIFTILERCTREFKDQKKYRNDIRYMRIWIRYVSYFILFMYIIEIMELTVCVTTGR